MIAGEQARRQRADANRPNFRQRGYTTQWDKARAAFLKAHPVCIIEGCSQPATVVDHRIPHKGNMKLFWDRSNWQPLCRHHHSSWKQRQERR
jgi:5-methylcytosine-specific restriction endonuclease McrA